jgi:hypothetical protein
MGIIMLLKRYYPNSARRPTNVHSSRGVAGGGGMNCYEVIYLTSQIQYDENENRYLSTEEEKIGIVAPTLSEALIKFNEYYLIKEIISIKKIIELSTETKRKVDK